ncbi:MAG: tetratricopeptide repeat protein [Pontibacterium sp.]
MKIRFYSLIATLLLSGCGLQGIKTAPAEVSAPPVYQAGELNRESVYDLLVAEIAGQQQRFDLALANYLKQARLTADPGVARRATRVAQYLRNTEAMMEAAELWKNAEPQNAEPYQILASLLLHQKRYEEALPLITQATEDDPEQMLAIIRSQISAMPDRVAESYLTIVNQQLNTQQQTPNLLITRGLLHAHLKQPHEALAAFDKALTIQPDNIDTITQKAEFLRTNDQYKAALLTIKPALKRQPHNRQLQVLYAQLLFQVRQHKAGLEIAKKLINENSKDYQLKFYLALLILENRQLEEAAILLNELLKQKPADSRPHYYLGAIAQQNGDIKRAIDHFMQVNNPTTHYQALSRISVLLDTPEDREQLTQILADVRNTQPKLAARLYALEAEWLDLHGFEEAALVLMEDALTHFSNDINLLYTRAMLLEPHDFDRTEKDLRRILVLDPESTLALNALGYTLAVHTTRYDEAYKLIDQALSQKPNDPAIIDSMGWVLFKLKRYQESVDFLTRAYTVVQDPEVTSHLIQAHWALGNKDKALDLLTSGLSKDPDNNYLQEAAQAVEIPQ